MTADDRKGLYQTLEMLLTQIFESMAPFLADNLNIPLGFSPLDRGNKISVHLKDCVGFPGLTLSNEPEIVAARKGGDKVFIASSALELPYKEEIVAYFCIATAPLRKYRLMLGIEMNDERASVHKEFEGYVGDIEELRQIMLRPGFAAYYAKLFFDVLPTMEKEWNTANHDYIVQTLDRNDYDAVVTHLATDKNCSTIPLRKDIYVLRFGLSYILIDSVRQSARELVNRNGIVEFCTIHDIPEQIFDYIRRNYQLGWNMSAKEIKFKACGETNILIEWVICYESYCPMDEDGYGEEEQQEIILCCAIVTDGKLAETPHLKPTKRRRRR